ncbi:HNH endonuclease [Hymenobacter rubidus]|uniref:HNH endonuclease n=1 Tax=Hymenobacter rubidus TaxID=1441626 RepID=UPI00191EF346|nr:HNH endonuclease [Hymenobacter rubidus]
MNFYVGNTDRRWFDFLRQEPREDVNFWKPSGQGFGAVPPNSPFLFRLKNPVNAIAGVGWFARQVQLPIPMAWDVFGPRNGAATCAEFTGLIRQNRAQPLEPGSNITCLALNAPIFFDKQDWLPVPADFRPGIVQGKVYSTQDAIGWQLWRDVQAVLARYQTPNALIEQPLLQEVAGQLLEPAVAYREAVTKVRLGQGAFRAAVLDAYGKKCAISGEKTLPVLDAAHIRPYADAGPSTLGNGLLLRSDLHTLFDKHYLTVNADTLVVEVSHRIREEFSNGKEYYRFQGQRLTVPKNVMDRPAQQFLQYHNNQFKG